MKSLLSLIALGVVALAPAQLVQTQTDSNLLPTVTVDGTIGSGEYGARYNNGGGLGFGGVLGRGEILIDADASSLHMGFVPGGTFNDYVVVYLDTKFGGFDDASMNDTGDPGRNVITNLARDRDELFPSGFFADYAVAFWNGGAVAFELTGGSLNFLSFANSAGPKELSMSLASLGLSGNFGFDWFAAYVSDTNFLSNETMPLDPSINGAGNPGFRPGGGPQGTVYNFYNRFEAVPEPGTMAALGLGVAAFLRRRRK